MTEMTATPQKRGYDWSHGSELAARWMAVASAAALLLPTMWLSLSTLLFLVFWIAAGNFRERWQQLRRQPVALASLLLLVWLAFTVLWSPVTWTQALGNWWQYRELLLLALMLSIVNEALWGWRMLRAFLALFFVTLLLSYGQWLGWVPPNRWRTPSAFTSHIAYSIMLAFVCWTCLWLALSAPRRRWLWVGYGAMAFFNLFFVNTGRTGQAVFLALLALTLLQRWRWRGALAAIALVSVLVAGLYAFSPTFHARVVEGLGDFEQQRTGQVSTSLAFRLEFWKTSLELGARHPVFGGGMASYRVEYEQMAQTKGWTGDRLSRNPHSEYLLIWTQGGIVGLLLLLFLGWAQWQGSKQLPVPARPMAQCLTATVAIGALFNSSLLDNQDGHFYAILTATLWSLRSWRMA